MMIQIFQWMRRTAFFVLALFFCGCTGNGMPGGLRRETGGAFRTDEYLLQAGDQVDLQIYREPQLSGTFRIDSAGDLRHPLFGSFKAGGLTVAQAEEQLTALLGERYLVNPRVVLAIVSAQSSNVVLLGEVIRPGVHPVPFGESVTLLQAIALAGGFSELANVKRVTVVRTVDGKETSIRVNVSRLISGDEPDMQLQPNDVIMVPQVIF
jgi:polysaccharide export outer membrane protein